jgi:hypothetical protein
MDHVGFNGFVRFAPEPDQGHEVGNDAPPSLHICDAVEVTQMGAEFVEQFHGSTVERQLDAQVATRAGLVSRTPTQGAIDHAPQVVSRGSFRIELSMIETYKVPPVWALRDEEIVQVGHLAEEPHAAVDSREFHVFHPQIAVRPAEREAGAHAGKVDTHEVRHPGSLD